MPTVSRFTSDPRMMAKREVLVSPDGSRYAVMLVRGDVGRDQVEMELVTGSLDSLEGAASYKTVGKFRTSGLGPYPITYRFDYRLLWLADSRRVAFLAEADDGTSQVVVADTVTGEHQFVTAAGADVGLFDISHRDRIIFSVRTQPPPELAESLIRDGFAVTEINARGLMSGAPNGSGQETFRHWIASLHGDSEPKEIQFEGGLQNLMPPQVISFSPDGRRAIIDSSPAASEIPSSWGTYTDSLMGKYAREALEPGGGRSWIIQRLYIVDVERGRARPLFDAPKVFAINHIVWSPDSRFVALGPTFLPPKGASAEGLAGTAIAVVDADTGAYEELAASRQAAGMYVSGWRDDGRLEVSGTAATLVYELEGGKWRLADSLDARSTSTTGVEVVVREDMKTPPRLVAVDHIGKRERLVLDLNPGLLDRYALGRVQTFQWDDPHGRVWRGRLYYPVEYQTGKRYPVVLQSGAAAAAGQFSLYGVGGAGSAAGLGPPGMSIYAAQVLANRGIAVLQVGNTDRAETASFLLSPAEPVAYQAAYEAAIGALDKMGLADVEKVGLSGFSRSGWHVEYALTHSSFPYAAAVVSDHMNGGYLQAALIGAAGGLMGEFAQNNGAPGVGDGLKIWLKSAPAFNAHKVRTPLRIQVESGGLKHAVLHWEMFNALSLLRKPVELFVIPNIERGAHNLQNPRQILASAEATVDWFDFWLNGREDPDASKEARYTRWRKLYALHERAAGAMK